MPFKTEVERGLAREERKRRWEARPWPWEPRLDVAREAERAVKAAIVQKRRKAEVPRRVEVPQLEGCQPLDWKLSRRCLRKSHSECWSCSLEWGPQRRGWPGWGMPLVRWWRVS